VRSRRRAFLRLGRASPRNSGASLLALQQLSDVGKVVDVPVLVRVVDLLGAELGRES